jgi:hypothetical protein
MQITLTMKELNRFKVISECNDGHLKVKDAAAILKLSQRQIFRLKAIVKKEGPKGVIHKTKGKTKPRWLSERIKDKINSLYKTKYKGFNISHMTEFLNEHENIKISRESTRQTLIAKGAYTPWKKHPKHRQWREPAAKEGYMLQFDTSDHDWLEGRGPKLYLIGGADDATSKCPGARFSLSDSCIENMRVLKHIAKTKGIPLVFYCDKDANFKTTRHQGIHQQLKGQYSQTQIERALTELGVQIIYADSAQAKGRIERKWGTFQDRLCSELRLHKISTLEAANHYLWEEFLPKHNRKFSHPAKEQGAAYRPLPKGIDLDNIFCLKEERTVASDNTISYNSKTYQLLPSAYRISFVKAKVMVHEHLNGSIHIFYKNKELKHKQIQKLTNKTQNLKNTDILSLHKT